MPPRGDAVRLVDDHTADVQLGQPVHETWPSESLRRQEQQTVFARDCPTKPVDLLGTLHR